MAMTVSKQELRDAVKRLSSFEQLVINRAYGMDGASPDSDVLIGEATLKDRQSIQRTRTNALLKLRTILEGSDNV